jgi:hypothetical protein
MDKRGQRFEENKNQGRWGELYGDDQLIINGYEVEETGKGSDRRVVKRDLFGNIIEEKLIDYKTGDAELSEKQKEDGAEAYRVWVPPFSRKFKPPF